MAWRRPARFPSRYEIAGCLNGAPVEVVFEGTLALGKVRFTVKNVSPREPLIWDEKVLALSAIDPVVLISLDPEALAGHPVPEVFRVESGLYDDGEQAVGRLVLSGCWSVDEGAVTIRAQLKEGWLNFEPMERVTQIQRGDGDQSPALDEMRRRDQDLDSRDEQGELLRGRFTCARR